MRFIPGPGARRSVGGLHRFQELALRLHGQGELVVVEGPAEAGLGEDLAAGFGAGRIPARADLPLRILAAVLKHCRLFVGNDSGIAHLAAGLGLPCVVLFGPTSPAHWAPIGRRISVLRDTVRLPRVRA